MKDLMFYDAGCMVGGTIQEVGYDAKRVLQEMDRAGVDKALLVHRGIVDIPQAANQLIVKEIQTAPERLKGVWCLFPQQCPELPPPDTLFDEMRRQGIAALTLHPFEHRYVPCRLTLGRYLDAAAERKVPLLLNYFDKHWTELYAFVQEFPRNLFIFRTNWGKWGIDRQIRPLLENYPGFHFGLSGYWVPEGIYELAKLYGASRLLYASGFPSFNHASQMLQIKYSGLSETEIVDIAGGNLDRILKEEDL